MSDRVRIICKLKTETILKNFLLRKTLSAPSTYFIWPQVVKPNPAAAVKGLLFICRYCGAKHEILLLLLKRAEHERRCPTGKPSCSCRAGRPDPGREQGHPWLPGTLCRISWRQQADHGHSLCPATALSLYDTV